MQAVSQGWHVIQVGWQFWRKITNDWVFNLAAMLAYALLFSTFPLLFVMLVLGNGLLNVVAPAQALELQGHLASLLPGKSQLLVNAVYELHRATGWLFVLLIVAAIFTGSRLFLTVENCFGIIFRLPSRHPVRQNVMAILMALLCSILIPLVLVASVLPSTVVSLFGLDDHVPVVAASVQVLGAAIAVVASALLFGVIYSFVPHFSHGRHISWRGTLVASGLLLIYEILFPPYAHRILRPDTYGATVGLIVAILIFFYYLALIMLLGAEVDAWTIGIRELPTDIATLLHRLEPLHHPKPKSAEASNDGQNGQNGQNGSAGTTNLKRAVLAVPESARPSASSQPAHAHAHVRFVLQSPERDWYDSEQAGAPEAQSSDRERTGQR